MKIVFFANSSWFLLNFNSRFALKLLDKGYKVIFLAPTDKYSYKFKEMGLEFLAIPMKRDSINPFHQVYIIVWLIKFFRNEKPDIVHNFTLKSVILGSFAAHFSNIKVIFNELTGLGFIFSSNSFKALILRFFTKLIFRFIFSLDSFNLILLNKSDFNFFSNKKYISNNSLFLIYGAGVDCNFFSPLLQSNEITFKVLMPSRVLWDKGVYEFVEASKIIKHLNYDIDFLIAGDVDLGNPTSVDLSYLNFHEKNGYIRWLGHITNIRELYHSVNIVVLPSYREGLPTSLTEAAACGLPLITTNVPGCIDVVENNLNGLIIPSKNFEKLAEAIIFLYENPKKRIEFGNFSREKALNNFSIEKIFKQRLELYKIK